MFARLRRQFFPKIQHPPRSLFGRNLTHTPFFSLASLKEERGVRRPIIQIQIPSPRPSPRLAGRGSQSRVKVPLFPRPNPDSTFASGSFKVSSHKPMTKCGYCGSTIIIGGLSSGTQRFCNKKCLTSAYVLSAAQKVPPDVIDRQVEEIYRGNCPKCRGLGPIDVHKVHQVWSALVLTRWTTTSQSPAVPARPKASWAARCSRPCSAGGDSPGDSS